MSRKVNLDKGHLKVTKFWWLELEDRCDAVFKKYHRMPGSSEGKKLLQSNTSKPQNILLKDAEEAKYSLEVKNQLRKIIEEKIHSF